MKSPFQVAFPYAIASAQAESSFSMRPEVLPLLQAAEAAMQRRDAPTAARALEQALGIDPEGIEVNLMAGSFAAQTGQMEPALACFQTVLKQDPNRPEALNGTAYVLQATGRLPEALPYAERLSRLQPRDPSALNTLGLCRAQSGDAVGALDAFNKAVQLAPQVGILHRNLAETLERLQRDGDAIEAYRRAYELDPSDLQARISASGLMMVHSRLDEAAGNIKKVLDQQPNLVPALILSARIQSERRMTDSAENLYRKASFLDPDADRAYGIWLIEEGRMSEATEVLNGFLSRHPSDPVANYWLAEARGLKDPSDPVALSLELLSNQSTLGLDDRVFVEFGIGRMLDRAKDYERAIHHLDEANRLGYELHFHSAPDLVGTIGGEVDHAIARFGRDEILKRQSRSNPSSKPIFIVGMIRSGTTLLEQIVASHPDVAGAGELRYWMEHASQAWKNPETYPQLASKYIKFLDQVDAQAPHVTDKAPLNYRFLGPIHAALPNAKILHIKRNPLDTCLSIYMMAHTKPPPFAYKQANIVYNYRQYLRMMEHWRKALPSGSFFEVDYQELVSNQEEVTRDIIQYLGLEWNDACLKPEKNASAVRTPSLMQVRQPVYKTSVERWRHYEPWLKELLELGEGSNK